MRRSVAGLAVTCVVVSLFPFTPVAPTAAPPPAPAAPQTPTDLARRTGQPVEVPAERSENTTVFANPGGTFSAQVHARPVRVRQGAGWAAPDATLAPRPDGTVAPRAAVVDLTLSGGGTGPLVRLGRPAGELALTWPGRLPTPALAGTRATYPDVLPGVDLVVRADLTGFAELLVVKTPEAARLPQLRRLRFGLASPGLRVRTGADGVLTATDGSGTPVLTGAVPYMWDSAGRRPGDRLDGPAPGGQYRRIRVTADGAGLTVLPDPAMLADPGLTFPLYVDPSVRADRQHWTMIEKDLPAWSGWYDSTTYRAQIGRDPAEPTDRFRAFFQLAMPPLAGRQILSAAFHVFETWAYSCTKEPVSVYQVDGIGPTTSWNSPPVRGQLLQTRSLARRDGCAAADEPGWVDFDVKALVNDAVTRNLSTVTVGLYSDEENNGNGAKEFRTDPYILIEYDTPPAVPVPWTGRLDPRCSSGWDVWVTNPQQPLGARLDDADADQGQQVRAWYEVTDVDDPFRKWVAPPTAWNTPGTDSFSPELPAGLLLHNHRFTLTLRSEDESHVFSAPVSCNFTVDLESPAVPPTVWSDDYGDFEHTQLVDYPGRFTFTSNGVADVAAFEYNLDTDGVEHLVPAGPDGTATVTIAPPTSGLVQVSVKSKDRSGRSSDPYVYSILVDALTPPVNSWGFDGAGLQLAGGLTLSDGATTGPGYVGNGLHFDGTKGFASASGPAVATDQSFTVAAWVKAGQRDRPVCAISQDGTSNSGFCLGINYYWLRWAFEMGGPDNSTSSDVAMSSTIPQPGVWTHLAGVYDAAEHKLRLYVNGRLAGEADHTGTWNANGPLRLGRGQNDGWWVGFWPGDVDEVRVFDRVASGREIREIITGDLNGPPTAPGGKWNLDEGAGATVSADALDHHYPLALTGGAAWTTGRHGNGLRLDGKDGQAYTSDPVLHTNAGFTVSAWVKLRPPSTANPDDDVPRTAVSQDGAHISGFALMYYPKTQRWAFETHDADRDQAPPLAAIDGLQVQFGVWTHLTGMYDADNREIRLYVNGRLAARTPRPGGVDDFAGAFQVGQRMVNGWRVEFFSGEIDDVQAVQQVLDATGIRAAMNVPDTYGANGRWSLDGDADASPVVARDESGSGHALSTTGGVTRVAGKRGAAAWQFDGTTGSAYADGPVLTTNASFTVSAWVRLDRTGDWGTAVSQDGPTNSGFALGYDAWTGRWAFLMSAPDNGGVAGITRSLGSVVPGVWTHLTGVYDNVKGEMRIYVNGRLAGASTYKSTWTATGALVVGRSRNYGGPVDYWPGAVDEVRAENRVLPETEIKTLTGPEAFGPEARWLLDEGTGTVSADASGNGHSLVLSGNASWTTGKRGRALHLDGADNTQAYSAGPVVDTNASFTVAAWVKLSRDDTWYSAVSQDGENYSGFDLRYDALNRRWAFVLYDGDSPKTRPTEYAAGSCTWCYQTGTWTHLAGVYDKATSQISLYVNGSLAGSASMPARTWNATGAVQLGRSKNGGFPVQWWPGDIDEVRLVNRALTSTEITALMNGTG
jgi:hypothetical protein